MIYAWNGFQLLSRNKELLENAMRVVWDELMTLEETKGQTMDGCISCPHN
jgi:superfamily II helicase